MKKFFKKAIHLILVLCLSIHLIACDERTVFQKIDDYIMETDNPHIPILALNKLSLFGTEHSMGKEFNDDNAIVCFYNASLEENFILYFNENYLMDGISFSYSIIKKKESVLDPDKLIFAGKGIVFPEEYNIDKTISFEKPKSVPDTHYNRISELFELFLDAMYNEVLDNCNLTLEDFGFSIS